MTETVETVEREVFRIPSVNIDKLNKKFDRLGKTADKVGSARPTWREVGREEVVVLRMHDLEAQFYFAENGSWPTEKEVPLPFELDETSRNLGWHVTGKRTYVLVEVDGVAPKLAGWTFRGTLAHVSDVGNLLKLVPGTETVPERFRELDPWCEWCNVARKRIDTFIVENDNGEWKQVGRNCLADFLGHATPEQVARYAQMLADLDSDLRGMGGGWGGYAEDVLDTLDFLATVALVIDTDGWVSRRVAEEYFKTATVDTARGLYFGTMDEKSRRRFGPVTDEHRERADVALTWARDLPEAEVEANDYLWNLHVVTATDLAPRRGAGILASVFAAKDFADNKRAKREARKPSEYRGEIKKREVFEGLTFVWETSYEGAWGPSYITKLVDDDDNVFVWFGKGLDAGIERGDRVDLKATVKAHEEYEGTKQTVVTRAVVENHYPAEKDEKEAEGDG